MIRIFLMSSRRGTIEGPYSRGHAGHTGIATSEYPRPNAARTGFAERFGLVSESERNRLERDGVSDRAKFREGYQDSGTVQELRPLRFPKLAKVRIRSAS